MNYNEVFPILDMINRQRQQGEHKGHNHFFDVDDEDANNLIDPMGWQVDVFEVTRDTDNLIDPNVIESVEIIYRNGVTENLTLVRGLDPPVDNAVQDSEYINNLMIVEVIIDTFYDEMKSTVKAKIERENGHGMFKSVDLIYEDE